MMVFPTFALSADSGELLFVLIVMGVLFLAGVGAVYIFVRQWRKEHRGDED